MKATCMFFYTAKKCLFNRETCPQNSLGFKYTLNKCVKLQNRKKERKKNCIILIIKIEKPEILHSETH